jgi:hypothetical protein
LIPRQLAERDRSAESEPPSASRPELRNIAPARDDYWLVGAALRRHQAANGLSEAQLAHSLGITVERLRWLQMRTRPDPNSPNFAPEVERLAATFDCDPGALIGILGP